MSTLFDLSAFKHSESNVGIEWEKDGKRYHIWVTNEGVLERNSRGEASIYCNPPRSLDRHDPSFFNTRHLDASKACNVKIIAQAIHQAKTTGELDKAIARYKDDLREEEEARQRQIALKLTPEDAEALRRIASAQPNEEVAASLRLIAEKISNRIR